MRLTLSCYKKTFFVSMETFLFFYYVFNVIYSLQVLHMLSHELHQQVTYSLQSLHMLFNELHQQVTYSFSFDAVSTVFKRKYKL